MDFTIAVREAASQMPRSVPPQSFPRPSALLGICPVITNNELQSSGLWSTFAVSCSSAMSAEFQREYTELSDDELLQLASDRQSLTEHAKSALDAEMHKRNLTPADLAKHERFVKRSEQRETRRRNRRLFGTRRSLVAWFRFVLWAVLVFSATALVAMWFATR
jgi:hypothetical protein